MACLRAIFTPVPSGYGLAVAFTGTVWAPA
jgi:hypothetical protein